MYNQCVVYFYFGGDTLEKRGYISKKISSFEKKLDEEIVIEAKKGSLEPKNT